MAQRLAKVYSTWQFANSVQAVVYSNNAGVIAFCSLSSQKNCYTLQILLLWMKNYMMLLENVSCGTQAIGLLCSPLFVYIISSRRLSIESQRMCVHVCACFVCARHPVPLYLLFSKTLLIIAFWLHYGTTSKRPNWICLSDAQQCGKIPFRKKMRFSGTIFFFWQGSGSQHGSFDMAEEGKKEKLLHINGPSRNKRILQRKKWDEKNTIHIKRKDWRQLTWI